MSVTYTIDSARRTIFLTGQDQLNRAMLEAVYDAIVNDPAFAPEFDTFADFSAVIYLDLDVVDIQKLVEATVAKKIGKGRFAIVTGEDQGRYSLGVYFKALAEGVSQTRQRIFRTAHEAQAWLTEERLSTA